jgi:hypothetical protein
MARHGDSDTLRYKLIQYLVDVKDNMCCSADEVIERTRLFDTIAQLSLYVNKQDKGRNFCLLNRTATNEQSSSNGGESSYWLYMLPVSNFELSFLFFFIYFLVFIYLL